MQRALLQALEQQDFAGAPRFLGFDQQGRETLSFLPGDVPRDIGHFDDVQLAAAASLLRSFHDATVGLADVLRDRAEVMCHNDWGPTNTVFRDGTPSALIDFDAISPGFRLWDLGYSAFLWLDLGNADYTADEQIRRLAVFADGYGRLDCPAALIAVCAIARQTTLATTAAASGQVALAEWAGAAATWTASNIGTRFLSPG